MTHANVALNWPVLDPLAVVGPGQAYPRMRDVPLTSPIYLAAENPKHLGTASHKRWEDGKGARTLGGWLATNTRADAAYASRRGQLAIAQYEEQIFVNQTRECHVCLEAFRGIGPRRPDPVWQCGHNICRLCASTWVGACPLCRADVVRMNRWNQL